MTSSDRNTVNYTLYNGNQKVYIGRTVDIERRIAEHRTDGKNFTRCEWSTKRTHESACQHELADIETYQRNHGGDLPKYNRIK